MPIHLHPIHLHTMFYKMGSHKMCQLDLGHHIPYNYNIVEFSELFFSLGLLKKEKSATKFKSHIEIQNHSCTYISKKVKFNR